MDVEKLITQSNIYFPNTLSNLIIPEDQVYKENFNSSGPKVSMTN